MRDPASRRVIFKARREASEEIKPADSLRLTSRLQNCRKTQFAVTEEIYHPLCGILVMAALEVYYTSIKFYFNFNIETFQEILTEYSSQHWAR